MTPLGSAGVQVSAIRYSLVIATLEDDGDLEVCLESLVALAGAPPFEVIVVDQNPDDRLQDLLRRFSDRLSLVHEQVPFRAACRARNLGARLARGTWVGFPDDDCRLLPDTLAEVDSLTREAGMLLVTGQTIDFSGEPNLLRWGAERVDLTPWRMFGCVTEATMFVRRDAFLKVGGFDERFGPGAPFPAAEGVDLVNRLLHCRGGGQACYSPRVRMAHPTKVPPWNRAAVARFHAYARGDGGLIAKNPQLHMLYWGARTLLAASLQALSLRGWRSAAYAARLAGLLRGLAAGLVAFHLRSGRR